MSFQLDFFTSRNLLLLSSQLPLISHFMYPHQSPHNVLRDHWHNQSDTTQATCLAQSPHVFPLHKQLLLELCLEQTPCGEKFHWLIRTCGFRSPHRAFRTHLPEERGPPQLFEQQLLAPGGRAATHPSCWSLLAPLHQLPRHEVDHIDP